MIHPPFTAATWEALPRGTKLVCRDGHDETFLLWAPEAVARHRLLTISPEGGVWRRFEDGCTVDGMTLTTDIIGIIQSVTLPEFWVVRWANGSANINPRHSAVWRSAEHWDAAFPESAPHYVEHHPARVVE
jgi:hypothetical protein